MNILILSASTGGGHMIASKAIEEYIIGNEADVKVSLVDTIEYINPIINKLVTRGYIFLVRRVNTLYKVFYDYTDKKSLVSYFITKVLLKLSKRLIKLINSFKADVIITTHPFATEMISILKEDYRINSKHICLITDYAVHNTWIKNNVDEYCVANEDMVQEMVKRGVSVEKVHPFGIPVCSKFFLRDKNDRRLLLDKLKLRDIITILIMSGSFGVNNIENIYKELVKVNCDFQIVILTGNNEKLYNKMNKILSRSKVTRVIGFNNEVYRYMNMADILITKPGGLTISEALASNIPMLIFDAIPGQEEKNSDFLLRHEMAISIGNGKNCGKVVEKLINDKDKLENIKNNCKKFDTRFSCNKLMKLIKNIDANKDNKLKVM